MRVSAALFATVLLACSNVDPGSPPGDAEFVDASEVAAEDVALDAPDVVMDVGGFGAGWQRLGGTPAECVAYVANTPAVDPGPLRWSDCPTVAGCKRTIVDWTSATSDSLWVRDPEPMRSIGGKRYLAYMRRFPVAGPALSSAMINVVQAVDGDAAYAIGTRLDQPGSCGAWTVAGDYGVVSLLTWTGAKGNVILDARAWSSLSSSTTRTLSAASLGATGGIGEFGVGPAKAFVQTYDPGTVVVVDPADGSVTPRTAGPIPTARVARARSWGRVGDRRARTLLRRHYG